LELGGRVDLKGYKLDDESRVVVNNLQSNTAQLSSIARTRDGQQQQQQQWTPLEHLNVLSGRNDVY